MYVYVFSINISDFKEVEAGGRNGQNSSTKAYNGTSNSQYYFKTPIEMFGKHHNSQNILSTVICGYILYTRICYFNIDLNNWNMLYGWISSPWFMSNRSFI